MNYRSLNIHSLLILMFAVHFSFSGGILYHFHGDKTDSSRINYVILAEGYTKDQENKFLDDVSNIVNSVFSRSPYREYPDFFNIWGIFVASVDSGVDKPMQNIERNTYFDCSFSNTTAQIVSIRNKTAAHELLAEHVPDYDLPAVIINDSKYGGSGAEFVTFTACSNAAFLFVHEAGHTFANLFDEYGGSSTISTPDISLARRKVMSSTSTERDTVSWAPQRHNMTTTTHRDSIPWKFWIFPETPIPTPETLEYADVIGLFNGAAGENEGYYRPKLDCIMRSTNAASFCSVCIETHIFKIYSKISPVKNTFPPDSTIDYQGDHMSFSVETHATVPNTIRTFWTLDNTTVHHGNEINLEVLALENKTYVLRAIVNDTTPLVRNPELSEALSDTVRWTVNVAITGAGRNKAVSPGAGIAVHMKKRYIVLRGLQHSAYPFALSLHTIHGRLVYSRDVPCPPYNGETLTVPLPQIPSDIYIVKVQSHSARIQRVFNGVVLH